MSSHPTSSNLVPICLSEPSPDGTSSTLHFIRLHISLPDKMKVPVRSGTAEVTLAELQTALDLFPGSDVYCMASMTGGRACNKISDFPSWKRNRILRDIADEMTQYGISPASDSLTEKLEKLASTFICARMHRFYFDHVDHVTGILWDRLKDFEEAQHIRHKVDALSRPRGPTGRKGSGRASSPDESDVGSEDNDEHSSNNGSSNDGQLSERDDETATALVRRPKAIPRHQATAETGRHVSERQMKTPNRAQQRPSGFGRRRRESDDSDASTPGTAVSEVFSPGCSKWSATTVPTTRSSTSQRGLHKQRDETPTRHRRSHDVTDTDPDPDSEYVGSGGEGGDSSSSSSSSHASDQEESEAEAVFTEDDESHPTVIMGFGPSETKPFKADHMMKLMLSTIKRGFPGYVYCFSNAGVKGYLKIGYATIHEVRKLKPASEVFEMTRETRSRLWKRLDKQRRQCKYDMKLEYDVYMPSAAHKMETLIHATLQEHRRTVTHCMNPECTKGHNEWFKVSLSEAKHHINTFQSFSTLKPFTVNGTLDEKWSRYAHDNLADNDFANMSVHDWFHGEWEKTIRRARNNQASRKLEEEIAQAQEIVDEKARLAYQAKLKKADMQLKMAKFKEEQAREQLAEKKRRLKALKKERGTI